MIKGRNFDEKAKLAYRVAPSSLIVEGTNPSRLSTTTLVQACTR